VPDFVLFILVLGGLIIGHEIGHFLAAKLFHVAVDEFGIGFPPRLLSLFQLGETRFTLNIIPFGGFVRLRGEDDPTVEGGLASSSKRARAIVLFAGPLANILLAVLAYTSAYRFAAPDLETVLITEIEENTPAQAAGLQRNDLILTASGQEVLGIRDLQSVILDNLGQPMVLAVERGAEVLNIVVTPRETYPEGHGPIGVVVGNPTKGMPWPESFSMGVNSVGFQIREILLLPSRLIQGDVQPDEARITGFKGMYDMLAWAGEIDRSSQRPFLTLNFIGVISAGLAIANLLPFPALDGGRLAFVFFEAISGRRVSPQSEGLIHTIGFLVLMAILVYVNLQDFINPISILP
jgi:regulator of sigma E protease